MTSKKVVDNVTPLEDMNTEEFLTWLLLNCEIEEKDYPVIRRDVQDFMLGRLVGECFDIASVEKRYPNLSTWLEAVKP